MERWEAIVERPIDPGQRAFEKIIQIATVVLKNEDTNLAPFETEWVIDTLLYKPVNLLETISEKRREDIWMKPLSDAFKLLAEIVAECAYAEKYFEDVVNLCQLNFDAELRKHALNCLIRVVKKSEIGAKDAPRHISALQEATQCKTPLALLVGAICEHHPSVIDNDFNRIWRTYLSMLENTKNTDQITKSILEGICSLFKHFGDKLPMSELNNFYDSLSYVYIKKSSCLSVCFEILRTNAGLFRERVSLDKAIRDILWLHIGEGSELAVLNIYKVVYNHVEKKVLEKIIATEVLPQTQSTNTRAKLTALRILAFTKLKSFGDLTQYVDMQTLENEFRRDKVTHGNADMVAWCIESNLPNSERLLQAAILFYDKLPATIRKKIVVNGILDSPDVVRQAAIHYLITQSRDNVDGFIQIWRDLYDASADDFTIKSEIVTIEFCRYLVTVVETFLEERREFEELPPKLTSLLHLTSKVVPLPLTTTPLTSCATLLCELAESYSAAELIAALRAVLSKSPVEESDNFYKSLHIEGCRDEATLHESCLALIQAPNHTEIEASDMLLALQIIFSSDIEPMILCDGLKKLDFLLTNNILDRGDICHTIRLVQKLRTKGDKTDRQIRILHREVLIFLGKHGNADLNNNTNDSENCVIVNLKKTLSLNLPCDGTTYKVNLQKILLLALHHEDPKTLQILMTMLCANLSSHKEPWSQLALARVIQTLAKVHANGSGQYTEAIQNAIELCDDAECIRDMLQYISTSKSCGVRKLLSTALSTLCEDMEQLYLIVERANVMLASSDSTTKKAGLDVAETVLSCLENNNSLSRTILPHLIVSIAKSYENDANTIFELAAKMFIEKKELFEKRTIQDTVNNLIKSLTHVKDVKIYKTTVKMTVDFVKALPDVDVDEALDVIIDTCQDDKVLYVLAVLKEVFDFDNGVTRKIIGRHNSVLLHSVFGFGNIALDHFELEAILKFLGEYCQIILELKYMETIQFLADLITKLTPKLIKKSRKSIKECFSCLKNHWRDTPKAIKDSFQSWTEMLPLKKITVTLEREYFPSENILCVNALKIMSNIFDTQDLILSDVKNHIAKWPKIVLTLYCTGRVEKYFYNETSYFNDILTVSLKFLTLDDVKKLLKEGSGLDLPTKDIGVMFCGYFIEGFSDILIERPFLLLDDDMKCCAVVLNDLVKYFVKKSCTKERCQNLLELVDKLWPAYQGTTTFTQKHTLLTNLECLPEKLGPESNVYRWVLDTVCSREPRVEQRIKMASFIPDEALSSPQVTSSVSSLFPARFRELRPELLEAVSNKPSVLFVEMLAALVANDASSGWWDEALDSCLSSLAAGNTVGLSLALYAKCERASVCSRVLAPLLRYSSSDLCENFLSKVLNKILTFTRPKAVKANHNYQKCMEDYIINLSLLLVAFERLPTTSLESSSSPLYSEIRAPSPWHIVREALTLCHTLRDSQDVKCPDDATAELKETYRQFQSVLYNCYCAAISRRRPSERIYAQVFGARAWQDIVDEQRVYDLPVTPSWIKRNKSVPVSVPQESSALLTSHSHIFLRTLSENPMLFDLHTQKEEVSEIQDISLPETDLNAHPCAATMTAMFRHVASLPFTLWQHVVGVLEGGSGNLKWLIAQIICNCKEELKPHASVLLPGLLAVVSETVVVNGNKCLNGLHLDVLDTILYWREDTTSPHLDTIAHHLITTCMEYRRRNVFDGLVRTMALFLEVYGSAVRIAWKSFETYYEDQSPDTDKAIFTLLRTICKNKIYIPEVLDKILSKFDVNPSKTAECFGLALAVCQNANEKEEALSKFKKFLSKCNVTNYVKVLYYSSVGCPDCCGEQEFRKIADYVTKVTSYDRTKCLHILSVYLSNSRPSAYITDMFDTVDLSEMVVNDHAAIILVKSGLHLMGGDLKRRAVLQISDMCQHSTVKVRKAALDVMLKAFEELFSPTYPPPSKRQKTESTPILSIRRDDIYSNSVITALGRGVTDCNEEVARAVREGVGARLDKDLGVRFAECFYIAIYLPSLAENSALDLSTCAAAILEMLYSHMRRAETYRNVKLREEPLAVREVSSNTKLLTLSKAFQGTFSSYSTSKARQKNKTQDKRSSIDVQVPIDSILENVLEFSQSTPQAARALLTEVLHSLLAGSRFDLGACLVPLLGSILDRPTDATPLCVDICRVLLGSGGSVTCLLDHVEKLRKLTANTEGASLTSLLYEEVKMRYHGDEIYQLGEPENARDVVMDETTTLSLEDLKCTFGKLANWDNLTMQQKKTIQKSALPPLWTEKREFVARLDSYEVPPNSDSWFDKMAASYKQEIGPNAMAWLRNMDKWPRRHFDISAITEATSWRHVPCDLRDVHSNMFTTDECLSEWAARLMIRSSYYDSLQLSETEQRFDRLSRSHELGWCVRANVMGIPKAVLECVKRNVEHLCESEAVPWLLQKLIAHRQVALERNDSKLLRDVLEKAESNASRYSIDPTDKIEMFNLMLLLHKDMKTLSYHELQSILQDVTSQQVDWSKSPKKAVSSVFEIAMGYYDDSWDTGALDRDSVLSNMSHVFCQAVDYDTPQVDMLLAILLNRLEEYPGTMDTETSQKFLEKLSPLTPKLDDFTLDQLKEIFTKLPAHLVRNHSVMAPHDGCTEKYKRCLQIVCDSGHLLAYYCGELLRAVKSQDHKLWRVTFDRMKSKIYENPYTGPSYKLLDKYKAELYELYVFDTTPHYLSRAESKLNSIGLALKKEPQATLRLTDLCPTLLDHREGASVARLFGLKNVHIVKFYDKVQVFTDSIRRPVILSVLLSNGRTLRAIHKTGERLASDAAAQRVSACAERLCGAGVGGYNVTLLDEDSALIEYLEGHDRLRALIESTFNINGKYNELKKLHEIKINNHRCRKVSPLEPPGTRPAPPRLERQFQSVLYNCYCAAICRRRPSERIYAQVFGARAWRDIVDEQRVYDLPVTPSWIKRNKSVPVSVPQESSALLTSHSHIFLRTLSENPMLFDLHTQKQEESEIQDISLPETDLNAHPCAATMTAMFRHVASLPFTLWQHVVEVLEGVSGNLKWLIAQIICNCKEELKPHASVLLPGLLAVVSETVVVNGNKCLNGLHLDVLDTILYWREDTTSPHLDTIAHHLITTCMEYRRRNVFDGLVRTMALFLEVYGSAVRIAWKSFETYYEDQSPDTDKAIFTLLRTICKNKIYIPEVLDKILSKFDVNPSKTAECFGLALAVCQNANEKEEALSKFKKFLSKCNVTNYVKVLYYSSVGCPDCCGEQEFRKIADYVTKVTSYDRTKCLHILSVYLSNSRPSAYITDMFDTVDLSEMVVNDHAAIILVKSGLHLMGGDLKRRAVLQISDMCQHSTVKVRKAALDVMLKAFEELFSPTYPPPSKRQKTESTPILSIRRDDIYSNSVITALGRGVTDCNEEVARAVREGVGARLDKDLGVRFAECFYIAIYLPSLAENSALDLTACAAAILEMLYSHMRRAETYRNVKLREEPLAVREVSSNTKLLTLSKAFQGTFSSYSTSKARQKNKTQVKKSSIDVQVPIDSILENVLDFAQSRGPRLRMKYLGSGYPEPEDFKALPLHPIIHFLVVIEEAMEMRRSGSTPQAARALLTEVLHSLLAGSRFDLGACLVPLLGSILDRPTDATPLCVDICRVLLGSGGRVTCLLDPVEKLRKLTANTEGASLTSLLYEEVKMRYHGDEIYQLGEPENARDVVMDETTTFSLEDLKCTFGKLANWDNLTMQQKKTIQKSALPPLWTEKREFVARLDSYEGPPNSDSWFDKMAASYKQEIGPNAMAWLRNMDKWPRRHFDISAITEATSWRHVPCDLRDVHSNMFTTDECLSEWAARLMIRSSYYDSLQLSETEQRFDRLSRSHELGWCVRANVMGIPKAVLECVKRNVEHLCESEAVPWLLQKLIAHRQVALERNDNKLLRDVLEKAESNASRYSIDPTDKIEMCNLMLLLHKDMKTLSYHELQSILQEVTSQQVDWSKSPKKAVSSVFEIAMGYYDDSWDTGALDRDSVLSNMSHVFCQAVDYDTPQVDMLLAILLNRLEEYPGTMDTETSQKFLEKLSPLTPKLDDFTLDQLKEIFTKLPAHLVRNHSVMAPHDGCTEKYKRCLQIVCDSGHLLAYYCGELLRAVKSQDHELWRVTFDRMKSKIYENPYTGPSYKLLDKYKAELYELYDFDTTPHYLSRAESKLNSIGLALKKEPQATLRLTDLCPTLLDHREGASVARLFGLKNVHIVKFYDKVQVFTDSIRRPVVLSVLLSNGKILRAIHKTGERLASDAAAQRVSACAERLCGAGVGGYNVTLLDEDSALIEYLEGHDRLRALIESTFNINVLNTVVRPADHVLIEASMTSALRTHKELCAKVPAHALRSAIEQNSSSVEDFISKKRNFTESLSYMSILVWILGLGDRHLQNIMCSRDGRARCVDWGDICRHGATEMPARLTRNMLAVCDVQVLESRLQSNMAAFRASHKLFEAVIKVSFKWMEELSEKFKYIQSILRGTTLSYHITREVTMNNEILKHKDKHLDLLACVFRDFNEKEVYSVEEQISCLLRHCTSPEILSVTRAGWEPWV